MQSNKGHAGTAQPRHETCSQTRQRRSEVRLARAAPDCTPSAAGHPPRGRPSGPTPLPINTSSHCGTATLRSPRAPVVFHPSCTFHPHVMPRSHMADVAFARFTILHANRQLRRCSSVTWWVQEAVGYWSCCARELRLTSSDGTHAGRDFLPCMQLGVQLTVQWQRFRGISHGGKTCSAVLYRAVLQRCSSGGERGGGLFGSLGADSHAEVSVTAGCVWCSTPALAALTLCLAAMVPTEAFMAAWPWERLGHFKVRTRLLHGRFLSLRMLTLCFGLF